MLALLLYGFALSHIPSSHTHHGGFPQSSMLDLAFLFQIVDSIQGGTPGLIPILFCWRPSVSYYNPDGLQTLHPPPARVQLTYFHKPPHPSSPGPTLVPSSVAHLYSLLVRVRECTIVCISSCALNCCWPPISPEGGLNLVVVHKPGLTTVCGLAP